MCLIFCCLGNSFCYFHMHLHASSSFQSRQSLQEVTAGDTETSSCYTSISQAACCCCRGSLKLRDFLNKQVETLTKRQHRHHAQHIKLSVWYSQAFSLKRGSNWDDWKDSDVAVCVCCRLPASFLLSSLRDKHTTMQIWPKCKYHIYMLDPQLHICINITVGEGGKPPGRLRNSSLGLRWPASWPSWSHFLLATGRQEGREPPSKP